MKNLFILTIITILSPAFLKAQTSDPELDYIKKAYSKEKKAIVDEYMELDVQQGGKFWSIYGAYEAKREKLAVERIKIIEQYIGYADRISAAQADKIAQAALSNNLEQSKMNLEYYSKVKTAIGAIKAAKFMQLETYLQTGWRAYVQQNIPLIEELDKTQKD